MAIIVHSKDQNVDWSRINIYPDQYVSENEKKSDDWIKHNMDYFANVAYSQYIKARKTFVNNYNLVKGILRKEDFYISDNIDTQSFIETLTNIELPDHVKHYSILNPPINTMIGELSRRPDTSKVKAMDDDSMNEKLQFKTEITQEYIMQSVKKTVMEIAAMQGVTLPDDQLQEMTAEKLQDQLGTYTTLGERWGNHIIESCKVEFNMKEISEDSMRDLLISAREFIHVFEDNTKTGVGVRVENTKNVWYLTLPDKKYISDPSNRGEGAFAAGLVHIMELSEVLQKFDLSKDEIDHLRNGVRELSLFSPRESNFSDPNAKGWDSIKYDTYSPLIVQQRLLIESQLKENNDGLVDWLGMSSNVNTFGNKYVVIQGYWLSKKKVGEVTYIDEFGEEQTALVDESYQKIPNQVGEVKWGYINQWYKGYKIGPDVYNVEPFEMLDYCPIIGVVHELKNVDEAKSLVDLLKPYQTLYNICMNQLFKLLEKEIGNVYLTSIRHVPTSKDGDGQDDLEIWEEEMRKRGVIFHDDSPENLKSPSNFNMFKNIDLTRTQEIQSRYALAAQLKNEAWELVGITRERLGGSIGATQTATSVQSGLTQSYAQTEPYFVQHEYIMNQVYQALMDSCKYVELKKPESTLNYINSEGEEGFISISRDDLEGRDLKLFVTSRSADQKVFQEMQELSQDILRNGGDPYDVSVLYTSNSIRQMRDIFKSLKDKKEQMLQAQQQAEQQQYQASLQLKQQELQMKGEEFQQTLENENYNKDLDRINKKEVEIIRTFSGKNTDNERDDNANGIPDILEMSRLSLDTKTVQKDHEIRLQELQAKQIDSLNKLAIEREKLNTERAKMANDLKIKKMEVDAKKNQAKKPTKK